MGACNVTVTTSKRVTAGGGIQGSAGFEGNMGYDANINAGAGFNNNVQVEVSAPTMNVNIGNLYF